ncbi:MAG: hypothetical protein JSR83_16680 [Proteobacteria bacterium]|nr:hypothetical protein [Pseudomonadota bacterium]
MRTPALCISLFATVLAACSGEAPLSLADKVKATSELIAERPECTEYARKIGGASNSKQVDQTYQAAKGAHCIKPDV